MKAFTNQEQAFAGGRAAPGAMGSWYVSLALSLFLILLGLYIHWSVVLFGALLPFVPLITLLLRRRAARRRGEPPPPH